MAVRRRTKGAFTLPRAAADVKAKKQLRTAVEAYKDGHREVYHDYVADGEEGWAWTHADDKATRAACTACTKGTLTSIRAADAERLRAEKKGAAA